MEGGSVFGRMSAVKRLAAPRALKVASVGTGGVTLRWAALKGAKHYVVLRDGKSLGKTSRHSYTDSKVVPGRTYRYSVRAYGANNRAGALSRSVRVTVPKPPAKQLPGTSPTTNVVTPIAAVGAPL